MKLLRNNKHKAIIYQVMAFAFIVFLLSGCSRKNTSYLSSKHEVNYQTAKESLQFPFQVLHSENASVGENKLNRYDLVAKNDTIQLNNNGYLILVHFSGKMLEFQGNTQINILEENRKINKYLNIELEKVNYRFQLSNIFSESDVYEVSHRGAVIYDPNPSSTYQLHPIEAHLSNKDYIVCFRWAINDSEKTVLSKKKFKITFKNIFDEIIKDSVVTGNQIQIDFSKYFLRKDEVDLLVYQVAELGNPELTSTHEVIWFDTEPFYVPRSSCEVTTALEAFELGNYLEYENAPIKESQYYYQLATQLSKNPIYQELYSYFKKRKQLD